MSRRMVVIGLDGATWSTLRPQLEDGAMPALARLLDRAAWGTLRSTIPPYTPPAWTSAVTGVNPGRHGIFGFVQGRDRPRLAHWGAVRAPAVWQHVAAAGGTTGLFHLPLTYPPPLVEGWVVGAVWMPTGRRIRGFASPPDIERRVLELAPDYSPVSGVEIFEDWRDPALAERIGTTVNERRAVLADLLESRPVDLVWAVIEAPDRLHHAYYRYLDPAHPMAGSPAAAPIRRTAGRAFRAVDGIVGLLEDFAGSDGVVVLCSDHGATGWDGYVYGNVLLARSGLLHVRASGAVMRAVGASGLGSLARRLLPARVSYRARRRVQGLIDPERTLAFAARLGSQGFSVNLAGRETDGAVEPRRAPAVLVQLESVLRRTQTPAGEALFPTILRRGDVYTGPYAGAAPDLVVEPLGWRWEVSDAMASNRLFRETSSLPLGCHHPDGVFALRGPGVVPSTGVRAHIVDVMPTLLYGAGLPVPSDLDGEVRRDLFGPASPVATMGAPVEAVQGTGRESPYTEQEEALITKYLTDLGYIG